MVSSCRDQSELRWLFSDLLHLAASLQFVGASVTGKDPMTRPAALRQDEPAKEPAKEPVKAGEGK